LPVIIGAGCNSLELLETQLHRLATRLRTNERPREGPKLLLCKGFVF